MALDYLAERSNHDALHLATQYGAVPSMLQGVGGISSRFAHRFRVPPLRRVTQSFALLCAIAWIS
jgi:hypothetical protein